MRIHVLSFGIAKAKERTVEELDTLYEVTVLDVQLRLCPVEGIHVPAR